MDMNATTNRQTESLHRAAEGLDALCAASVLDVLHQGQVVAAVAVAEASPQIELAASAVADSLGAGGNLAYVGAGSAGLMAMVDGLELTGTFGIPMNRIRILFAGGQACLSELKGGPEDDESLAATDVAGAGLAAGDAAIIVSASGTTPYSVVAQQQLKAAGVKTIAIANNADCALLRDADHPIFLPTPAEVIAGSTRMGAGTAQKIALNMLSTLVGVHLGHIYDGMMVNLQADNLKLQDRSKRMVATIAGCSDSNAGGFLERADGSVKIAILLASGVADIAAAEQLLTENQGKLRPSLDGLSPT